MMIRYRGDASVAIGLEKIERDLVRDHCRAADPATADRLGLSYSERAGMGLVAARRLDWSPFNCARGFGCEGETSEADLGEAVRWLGKHCAPNWRMQFVPATLPDDFASRAARLGLACKGLGFAKLYRDASPLPPPSGDDLPGLEIRPVDSANALACLSIADATFNPPLSTLSWIANFVGRDKYSIFAAYDDGPVALGMLFVSDGWGWLGWDGTLADHRGAGVQRALIRHRVAEGLRLGVTHFAVECIAPQPDNKAFASYRNYLRAGFSEAYVRAAYGPA